MMIYYLLLLFAAVIALNPLISSFCLADALAVWNILSTSCQAQGAEPLQNQEVSQNSDDLKIHAFQNGVYEEAE